MTEQQGDQPKPVFQLTAKEAETALATYCKGKGYRLCHIERWTRWLDLPRPCWSTMAMVEKKNTVTYHKLGVQVYEGGEVLAFPIP